MSAAIHIAEESTDLEAEMTRLAADQGEAKAALTGEELASLRAQIARAKAAFVRGEGSIRELLLPAENDLFR